jgi:hypothetical protein
MSTFRQRLRLTTVLALTMSLLVLAVHWSHRQSGITTPTDCLCAYYEACHEGNSQSYLSCLADPLRLKIRREFTDRDRLAALLRQRAVKNWVVVTEPVIENDASSVVVDEVRVDSIKRVRFRLEYTGSSWLIVAVDPLQDKQPPIRFGTDVRSIPDEPQNSDE